MPVTKEFDLKKYIVNQLRKISRTWHEKDRALLQALRSYGNYECAQCAKWFEKGQVQVDHILPAVPVAGWDSFDGFISRLFCTYKELQVLCKPCHSAKSKSENAERRKYKKLNE